MNAPINRRNFLTKTATLAGATVVSAAPVLADNQGRPNIADEANAAFARFIGARAEADRLDAAYAAACDTLPEWVRPGPYWLNGKGEFIGIVVGSPRDDSVLPPDREDVRRISRPSFDDVWSPPNYRLWKRDLTGEPLRKLMARRNVRVREWIARRRRADALRQSAGLPAILDALNIQTDAAWRAETDIDRMQDRTGDPTLIAARLMVLLAYEGPEGDQHGAILRLLGSVANQAEGFVREHAVQMLADLGDGLEGEA